MRRLLYFSILLAAAPGTWAQYQCGQPLHATPGVNKTNQVIFEMDRSTFPAGEADRFETAMTEAATNWNTACTNDGRPGFRDAPILSPSDQTYNVPPMEGRAVVPVRFDPRQHDSADKCKKPDGTDGLCFPVAFSRIRPLRGVLRRELSFAERENLRSTVLP